VEESVDLDVFWSQLESSDYVWVAIFIGVAVAPFFSAWKQKTSLALAMILSTMLIMFLRFFLDTINIFGFEEIHLFAMIPALVTEPDQFHRFITAAWLHSNWLHVLSNIIVIGLVGVPLEQRLGGKRWLAVYFLGLLGGNIAWVAAHPNSFVPALGASGAAFGLLGAYMACWPNDEVEFPLLFFIRPWPIWIIVAVRLGLEVYQMYSIEAGTIGSTNIAHLAHVGGFFLAYALARPIAKGAPSSLDSTTTIGSSSSSESGTESIRKRAREKMGSLDNDPWMEAGKPLQAEAARILERLRAEGDELETRQAWLEELAEQTICPVCEGEIITDINGEICRLKCSLSNAHIKWP